MDLIKRAVELTLVADPEKTPYKSKYAARTILHDLLKQIAALPLSTAPVLVQRELTLFQGAVEHLLAKNYFDCEELATGDTYERLAVRHLAVAPAAAAPQLVDAWNQLAALHARRGSHGMRRARAVLLRSLALVDALGTTNLPRQAASARRESLREAGRARRRRTAEDSAKSKAATAAAGAAGANQASDALGDGADTCAPETVADESASADSTAASAAPGPTLTESLAASLARALPLFARSTDDQTPTAGSAAPAPVAEAGEAAGAQRLVWAAEGAAMAALSPEAARWLAAGPAGPAGAAADVATTADTPEAEAEPTPSSSGALAGLTEADHVLLGCARACALADGHAIGLFSIAQVYTLWGASSRGASYCRQTLALQLTLGTLSADMHATAAAAADSGLDSTIAEAVTTDSSAIVPTPAPAPTPASAPATATAGASVAAVVMSPAFDAVEWACNAMRLSSFFTARDLWANADECLRAARTVADAAAAAATAAAAARGEASAGAGDRIDQLRADIARARVVMIVSWMRASADKLEPTDEDDDEDEDAKAAAEAKEQDPVAAAMAELTMPLPPLPLEAGESEQDNEAAVAPQDWLLLSPPMDAATDAADKAASTHDAAKVDTDADAATGTSSDSDAGAVSVPSEFASVWRSLRRLESIEAAHLRLAAEGEAVSEAKGWFPELQPAMGRARSFALFTTPAAARAAFKEGLSAAEQALRYYVLDGFVSDHIEVVQELSALWKTLARFEEDPATRSKIAKRRAEMIEPIVRVLSAKAYRDQWLDLCMELALCHMTMVDAKSGALAESAKMLESTGSGGRDPAQVSAHMQATVKVNQLCLKAAHWFAMWFGVVSAGLPAYDARLCPSLKVVPPLTVRAPWPVPVLRGEDNIGYRAAYVRNALTAARAFGKIVSVDTETQVKTMAQAVSFYALVIDFAAANAEYREEFAREADVATEMLQLSNKRIALIMQRAAAGKK